MSPQVLIISPQVRPLPHSGAGMRGHFQSVHLSKRWPITLATESGVYEVRDGVFTQKIATQISDMGNASAFLRSVLTRNHYLYEKFNCRKWAVPDLADFTHVIVHYPALLECVRDVGTPFTQILFDTHNNEREYYESVAARTTNPLKRVATRSQASVSERIIREAAHRIGTTISVSESDRDWVVGLCRPDTTHFVVPNNLFQYNPTEWTGRNALLFVGSLHVPMNIQALDWFVTNVWQGLRRLEPDLEFVVAGRDPSPTLIASLERQGIEVVANAATLTGLYADALCSVIPAVSGSGGKIKVGEALAQGVPVLTTAHGLVGQPEAVKACCVVRDDPAAWIEAIQKQSEQKMRSDAAWKKQVEAALGESYFGTSIMRIADFIDASCQ